MLCTLAWTADQMSKAGQAHTPAELVAVVIRPCPGAPLLPGAWLSWPVGGCCVPAWLCIPALHIDEFEPG